MGDANIIPQQKIKNKKNQTMVVKHCQAFQISVAHQRDLEAHNHQHTIQNQTDQKVKHLFREITKESCRYLISGAIFYKLIKGSFFFLFLHIIDLL